jgi:hypothetical protein
MSVIEEIAAERKRQIEGEGFASEHDDKHVPGELARAAACYAVSCVQPYFKAGSPAQYRHAYWPWGEEWWKPKGFRRDLVRAAALIVAEIERVDRMSEREAG